MLCGTAGDGCVYSTLFCQVKLSPVAQSEQNDHDDKHKKIKFGIEKGNIVAEKFGLEEGVLALKQVLALKNVALKKHKH